MKRCCQRFDVAQSFDMLRCGHVVILFCHQSPVPCELRGWVPVLNCQETGQLFTFFKMIHHNMVDI